MIPATARGSWRPRLAPALIVVSAAVLLASSAGPAVAADTLETARALYASAAYEEALATLNRLRAAGVDPADVPAVEQYRVFCLLALGRDSEAERAIETVVRTDPMYRPSGDLSPRVRSAFTDVRRRLLPTIVPQEYLRAKALFDREDFVAAAAAFAHVLEVLADPDLTQLAAEMPLSDLKVLASGFQELSARSAAPPPPPPPPPAPEPEPEHEAAPIPAPAPPIARIYDASDPNVVPPRALHQELPMFSGRPSALASGVIEIVIDEGGLVESAVMRERVTESYDRQALNATRRWRYEPATVDGVPVKFRKVIQIAVRP
jgi:TonB family protein